MKAKRGHVSANDAPATKPEDWNDAFVTRSVNELRTAVALLMEHLQGDKAHYEALVEAVTRKN